VDDRGVDGSGGNVNDVTSEDFVGDVLAGIEFLKNMEVNHLFQHCETGAVAEYSQIEETISSEVMKIIAEWMWEVME
jgi:hypothetical protein